MWRAAFHDLLTVRLPPGPRAGSSGSFPRFGSALVLVCTSHGTTGKRVEQTILLFWFCQSSLSVLLTVGRRGDGPILVRGPPPRRFDHDLVSPTAVSPLAILGSKGSGVPQVAPNCPGTDSPVSTYERRGVSHGLRPGYVPQSSLGCAVSASFAQVHMCSPDGIWAGDLPWKVRGGKQ